MINTLYIEAAVADLPRTQAILKRFPKARRIAIQQYSELFNPKAQNFRLQKQNPALILAEKQDGFVLPAPLNYNIGGQQNFYFSHMMNCVYDCRYCFLQGMYRSANYVVFVNYEDFFADIERTQASLGREAGWFFSGYDCDSLALEPITKFIDSTLPVLHDLPNARLELRTKSTHIQPLLAREALANCVVAFSLSPSAIVDALEHKTARLEKRLDAAVASPEKGWPIGLRFDPVIYTDDFERLYADLFHQVFTRLPRTAVHSVSLGPFRMPQAFYKKMVQLYPEEPMFAVDMDTRERQSGYAAASEERLLSFCRDQILRYIPQELFFPCVDITASPDTRINATSGPAIPVHFTKAVPDP